MTTHLTNHLSIIKSGEADLLLISRKGEHILTWKLLLSLFSPIVADLVRECSSGQAAISLPFDKEQIQAFVDMLENREATAVVFNENEVSLLLRISGANLYNFSLAMENK